MDERERVVRGIAEGAGFAAADEHRRQRSIDMESERRFKKLVEDIGLSATPSPPAFPEILTAARKHIPAIVEFALWRIEQPDFLGRRLMVGELKEIQHVADVIVREIGSVIADLESSDKKPVGG